MQSHQYDVHAHDSCTDVEEKQVMICSSSSDTLSDLSINLQLLALQDDMECGTEGTGL